MKIDALLGVDVVALEGADELSVLVDLTAPPNPDNRPRPPATLVVVLDRSGSMQGERLAGAKQALAALVDRLDPMDRFGLVVFDDRVEVTVAAAPLSDKPAVRAAIAAIEARGMTDLSGGYLRGLQEARRVAGPEGATVLLISDGHANQGITEPRRLAEVAGTHADLGVTTSALGYGLGYDETLLAAVAKGGRGNELFAENPDAAVAMIAGEIEGLLSQTIQAASLLIRMSPQVAGVEVANDLPATTLPEGVMVELGGFYADEQRKLLLTFAIPGAPALGLLEIATLELRYVAVADLVEQVVTVPLQVNVVPGDEARGRRANPTVYTEIAFQHAQRAKRQAARLLSQGDVAGATAGLTAARGIVAAAMAAAPEILRLELDEEAGVLDALVHDAARGQVSRSAKLASADSSLKSRTRGRNQRRD